MSAINQKLEKRTKTRLDSSTEQIRSRIREYSKSFKTSWVNLGQALYTVWQDKMYHAWGYDKFEYYVDQEVGLPKQLSMKLLKSYNFLEEEEPAYLSEGFYRHREASRVPGYEAVNALRMAKQNKSVPREYYMKLKRDVFENGKNAQMVRQDLTTLLKQRMVVDPQEERRKRNEAALRKLIHALETFKKDMEALRLVPNAIISESQKLMKILEEQL